MAELPMPYRKRRAATLRSGSLPRRTRAGAANPRLNRLVTVFCDWRCSTTGCHARRPPRPRSRQGCNKKGFAAARSLARDEIVARDHIRSECRPNPARSDATKTGEALGGTATMLSIECAVTDLVLDVLGWNCLELRAPGNPLWPGPLSSFPRRGA